MKRIIAILLLLSMLFSWCNIAYASTDYLRHEGEPIVPIDFFTVNWSMTENELLHQLENYRYSVLKRQDGNCTYSFCAYFAGYEADINLCFDEHHILEEIWLYPEPPNSSVDNTTICVALLSSKLGMPIAWQNKEVYDDDYVYTRQTAIWPVHNGTVYVCDCENEVYCSVDEENFEIEIEPYIGFGTIDLYPSCDYEWVLEHYKFNK